MIEGADAVESTARGLREHDVQLIDHQFRQQALKLAFTTDNLYRGGEMQSWFEETIGNKLRKDIGDADHQAQRSTCRLTLQGVYEFTSQCEDFIRIAKDDTAYFGKDQMTAYACKQLLS